MHGDPSLSLSLRDRTKGLKQPFRLEINDLLLVHQFQSATEYILASRRLTGFEGLRISHKLHKRHKTG